MTREQIKDLVIENTRRTDKEALILTSIGFALNEIAQLHDFKIMKVEVDIPFSEDDMSVSLPTDAVQISETRFIESTTDTIGYPIPLVSKNYSVRTFVNPAGQAASRPTELYEHNGQLYFNAPSDGDYILRMTYMKYPEELEQATDTPLIPKIENAIVAYCTSYVYDSIQMYNDGQVWMQKFYTAIRTAISADKRRSGTRVQLEPFPGRPVSPVVPPYLDPFAPRDWP
jgi:hypothetical protein